MGTPGHGALGRQCAKSDAVHLGGGFNRNGFVPTAGCFSYLGGEVTTVLRDVQVFWGLRGRLTVHCPVNVGPSTEVFYLLGSKYNTTKPRNPNFRALESAIFENVSFADLGLRNYNNLQ